jgi:hypothetical protein
LTDYQLASLFCPERYAVVEATSKAGKTVGALAWLTEQAMMGKPGQNTWWIAPIFPQTKVAYRRLKRSLTRGFYEANESELTLTLSNGVRMWFKGSENPDSLYGEDVIAAVIDEATRVKEESWHAIRTTLTATRGPLRIIGNVKGRRNWAYQLARRAEAGEEGMHYAKITAEDAVKAGILDAAEVEDAKRMLPEAVFRELYMAEPSDDGGNPFGLKAIEACVAPMSAGPPVCFGLDLAKSGDWCVLIGLDKDGRVCHFDRWQGSWQGTIPRVLAAIGTVPCLVDSTGAGDPVLEALQHDGRDQGATVLGYVFSAPSKQRLMEGLAVAIQQKRIRIPPDEPPMRVIVSELEAFEYVYRRIGVSYSSPEGMHDDCVCSLALAAEQLGYAVEFASAVSAAPQRQGSGLRGNYAVRRT